ncbi:MAG: thiamine pyrophosphate-requiring protein [Syntrophobacteraceae bacterium]|nr:thiamine pyrophosphate-requiring protein [Syntrophobacteraceae bacterium]
MEHKTFQIETTAQAYLQLLSRRGVEYLFANAGTDFAPLIDAFAFWAAMGRTTVKPVAVPHENVAVAMAHGYYLATGKPQAVMVHVNVGTANGLNGIINAARDHIPILFTAGRTPITEQGLPGARDLCIHWAQESFDQAGMIREYVKWDYELRNFTQLESVVDRALEIAMSEPRGPVYLTLPREVLAEPHGEFTLSDLPRRHTGGLLHPDPRDVEAAAAMFKASKAPLIITSSAGSCEGAVEALTRFAEKFGIPTVTFNQRTLSFPTTSPMHAGFSPAPLLDEADLILVVESDVPWYPSVKHPREECKVIQLGVDPLYSRYPIRSFPRDLAIRSDPATALGMLHEALSKDFGNMEHQIAERFARIEALHHGQRAAWRKELEKARHSCPLDPAWVSHCIDAIRDEKTVLVNEYDLLLNQVELAAPSDYFGGSAAGGLGWGLGASLGIKLAWPHKTVVTAVGDGSYMFGNPTPFHFVSRALGLPTLTVVFNNHCWNAVRRANAFMYPNGWAKKANSFPLTDLSPSPDYELVVAASGGYGERVDKPSEVLPALQRALHAVRVEKRQAVLNMVLKDPGE